LARLDPFPFAILGLRLPRTPGLSVDRSLLEHALTIKSESTEIPEVASRNVTLAAPRIAKGKGSPRRGPLHSKPPPLTSPGSGA
jgi:hypothetical protein